MSISFLVLKKRTIWLRPDTTPFLIFYGMLLNWQMQLEEEDDEMLSVYVRLTLIGILFLHSLTFLSSYWSAHMRARVQYTSHNSQAITSQLLLKYPYVKAYHHKANGSYCDIVPVMKEDNQEIYFIKFMENKYILDNDKKQFVRLKPDVSFDIKDINQLIHENKKPNLFEKNTLLVPMKHFNEILKEQMMEPFSFFQMQFSISLWLLDENSLYAIFTLFLLFMTGCTVALQRMRTMLTLRQMKLNHSYVTVFRKGSWSKISSEFLVPGDLILLQTAEQTKAVETKVQPIASQQQLPPNQHPMMQPVQLTEDEQFMKDQVPFNKYLPARLFKTESMNVDSYKSLPCDILLLTGTAVVNEAMLTGESVPQVKDACEHVHHSEKLEIKGKHKQNVLFCGTEVLQLQGTTDSPALITPPKQNSCIGLVLRTGFDTAKGKLIRTVFYNNENANVKQKDGLVIVLVLLIFAVISSAYVLYYGLEDKTRDKNKLFLRCILIVTTVVPPELPMILSIAVNQSMIFLQIRKIFCTEPYRIPLAGKVSVLAFDKTGTLTKDQLNFVGIVDDCSQNLKQRTEVTLDTQTVLAGCHGLIFADSKLQGDPIELLFFENNNQWNYSALLKESTNGANKRTITIKQVYSFKSDLKRMSTLVVQEDNGMKKSIKVLVKGAPESIEPLLLKVPQGYTECYEHFTNLGYRVLCLADRIIDDKEFDLDPALFPFEKIALLAEKNREELEQKLIYRGLLICESPLKNDTASWLKKFRQSYFTSIIITGDNMLTAIAVAKQVDLDEDRKTDIKKPSVVLDTVEGKLFWKQRGCIEEQVKSQDLLRLSQIKSKDFMLCMPTQTLSHLENHPQLPQILTYFTVFARASPKQKEQIILALKKTGLGVLMCGDGTNDVGGLKKADVGIALVTKNQNGDESKERDDDEEEESNQTLSFSQQLQKVRQQQEEMRKQIQQQRLNPQQARQNAQRMASQQFQEATSDIFSMGQTYKFGDACIAAPFTSKMSTSIRCVHTILKQGVCTLVTTIQTYKIMALLSLINAYSLSSLHMQALKLSSNQMTIMGIFGTAYYFCYSSAKPQKYLSRVKPSSTIFEFSFVFSLIAQISLHIYTMDYALHKIGMYYSSEIELQVDNDEEFKPTFLNTVAFIIQMLQQSCIFLFNHPGEPHMTRLEIKSKFFKSLIIPIIICLIGAFNLSEDINYFFELKFPEKNTDIAAQELGLICIAITLINYLIERVMKFMKYGKFYGYI